MNYNYVPELLSLLPLGAAFFLMWKEHKRFRSLVPFLLAVNLLFVARLSDVVIQYPSTFVADVLGIPKSRLDLLLNGPSDLTDMCGVFLIVVGFVQTVRFERKEEKRMKVLEALLPICAWSKKYRTDKGDWLPIEQYLSKSGHSLTHGICPECIKTQFGSKA